MNVLPENESLLEALKDVHDPELPVSVVDFGMIYGIDRQKDHVRVQMTLTTMGCPAIDMLLGDMRERLLKESGVGEVEIEIVWSPPWNKSMISDKGRDQLAEVGITV